MKVSVSSLKCTVRLPPTGTKVVGTKKPMPRMHVSPAAHVPPGGKFCTRGDARLARVRVYVRTVVSAGPLNISEKPRNVSGGNADRRAVGLHLGRASH